MARRIKGVWRNRVIKEGGRSAMPKRKEYTLFIGRISNKNYVCGPASWVVICSTLDTIDKDDNSEAYVVDECGRQSMIIGMPTKSGYALESL